MGFVLLDWAWIYLSAIYDTYGRHGRLESHYKTISVSCFRHIHQSDTSSVVVHEPRRRDRRAVTINSNERTTL